MTSGNVILALFVLCVAAAIAGEMTEGLPVMGGIDVREEYRADAPITHPQP